jgi:hypothetical protein
LGSSGFYNLIFIYWRMVKGVSVLGVSKKEDKLKGMGVLWRDKPLD